MPSAGTKGMASTQLAALIAIFALITSCCSLKLIKVEVPRYITRGNDATLECQYELEGEPLYAIKWYKENEEFYRFVPRSVPPKTSYNIQGIKVDHMKSDRRKVVLRNVNLKTSGVFRCEVSAEAPVFASAAAEAPMTVIFIPANGPHINGERKQYLIGDEVNLNCTSGKSYPASVLHWYINDKEVTDGGGLIHYEDLVHTHGLVTTTLGLRIRVEPHHYLGDSMKLRCLASLSPVIWTGNKESVVEPVLPEKIREALLLVKGGSGRRLACSFLVFAAAALLSLT